MLERLDRRDQGKSGRTKTKDKQAGRVEHMNMIPEIPELGLKCD